MRNDSVSVHLVDVELRVAVQALAPYLDRPVVFGQVAAGRVSVETPTPVPRADVPRFLRGLVEAQGLELVADTVAGLYRVKTRDAPSSAPPPSAAPQPGARTAGPAGAPELFVVHLHHARALAVAATVNALYGHASALGEGQAARGAGPTLGQQLGQNPAAQAGIQSVPPQAALPSGGGGFAGEVTIVPDPSTNSLLVRASPQDFALVEAAVRQVDVRPLQVLVEVLIAEVRRDHTFDLGLAATTAAWRVPGKAGVEGVTVATTMAPTAGLGDVVLHVMKSTGRAQFDAIIRMAEQNGYARILSRPVVLAANNEVAEILVGSQQPFVEISRTLPTENAVQDRVVQYKEVGTKLSVKPTISADGYVSLAITQEVSSATATLLFGAPVISTRTVQTTLLVRDSQTVVLGGLSDMQRQVSTDGIPLLSRIPFIGGLFGHQSRQKSETEFFLFLTPRIVRSDADAEQVTDPLRERAGVKQ